MPASARENTCEGAGELLPRVLAPTLPTLPVAGSVEREEVVELPHGPFYLLEREQHRGRDVVLFPGSPERPSLRLARRERCVILVSRCPTGLFPFHR